MKMFGLKPNERVKNGPYLRFRFMRMGSNLERELVRRRVVEWMTDGPGGRFFRWSSMDLIRAAMQRVTTVMNQISIVD